MGMGEDYSEYLRREREKQERQDAERRRDDEERRRRAQIDDDYRKEQMRQQARWDARSGLSSPQHWGDPDYFRERDKEAFWNPDSASNRKRRDEQRSAGEARAARGHADRPSAAAVRERPRRPDPTVRVGKVWLPAAGFDAAARAVRSSGVTDDEPFRYRVLRRLIVGALAAFALVAFGRPHWTGPLREAARMLDESHLRRQRLVAVPPLDFRNDHSAAVAGAPDRDVALIQTMLSRLTPELRPTNGHAVQARMFEGRIDGVYGPRTRQAINDAVQVLKGQAGGTLATWQDWLAAPDFEALHQPDHAPMRNAEAVEMRLLAQLER